MPLAPIDGAANVTITPLAGAPFDVTVTTNGAAHACTKAVPMAHFCCAPLVAVIEITGVGFELELQLVMRSRGQTNEGEETRVNFAGHNDAPFCTWAERCRDCGDTEIP